MTANSVPTADELNAVKQGETYTIRFSANTAGYTNYHLDWYEHTDS